MNCKCGIIPERTTSSFEAGVERLIRKGRQSRLLNSNGIELYVGVFYHMNCLKPIFFINTCH